MDLNQMLVFAKVVEFQNFTKAGKELGMEKSNVSTKISKLEERLGLRLLNRTTRSVTTTEAGSGYYQYCSEILSRAEEADAYIESLISEPRGVLRITLPVDIGQLITKALIKPFLEQYRKVNLELFFSNRKVDLIREKFDIALRAGLMVQPDSSHISQQIFQSNSGLYASPQLFQNKSKPESLKELEAFELISFASEDDFGAKSHLKARLGSRELNLVFKHRLKINDMLTLLESAALGIGMAVLPCAFIQRYLDDGTLVPVMPELQFPEVGFHVVYPSRRLKSAKVQVFLDFIKSWKMEF